MSDLVAITDVVDRGLARLPDEWRNSDKIRALATALLEPLQDVEEWLSQLYLQRWVDAATGVNLDVLGDIVGQPREGRTDIVYRLWIKARIAVNRSTGLADQTLAIAELVEPVAIATLTESPPAAYVVRIEELTSDPNAVYQILRLAKPAGVRFLFEYTLAAVTDAFTFAVDNTPEVIDTLKGLGNDGGTTGGHFADVLG